MLPGIDYIKTALNAIMCRFRNVQANVDAVQANVDAVQANVDAVQANVDLVDQKATKCLYVKLKDQGQGGYLLDTAPTDIIKHIQSGGNVYIQTDSANFLQLDVIVLSEEPVCLIFYQLTKDEGLSYFVWDTEELRSHNYFRYSRYLTATGTGSLRCDNYEITVGSGYMSKNYTVTDWVRQPVKISHMYSKSADTYILIDCRKATDIAGVKFILSLNGKFIEVPFGDYETSDYPLGSVRYILLHITALNDASCHVKELFYGETLDALEYKPINIMLYSTNGFGYSLRQFSTSGQSRPTDYSLKNNVDVTTYIL